MSVAKCLDSRIDDVVWGLEIRLSDAKVDDIAAGGYESLGSGEYLKGGLGA